TWYAARTSITELSAGRQPSASQVAAVRLLGRRRSPEDRAGLEVVLGADHVADEMRVRRNYDPLLALRVFDHHAWLAGTASCCTDCTDRCHEPVRHRAARASTTASTARVQNYTVILWTSAGCDLADRRIAGRWQGFTT